MNTKQQRPLKCVCFQIWQPIALQMVKISSGRSAILIKLLPALHSLSVVLFECQECVKPSLKNTSRLKKRNYLPRADEFFSDDLPQQFILKLNQMLLKLRVSKLQISILNNVNMMGCMPGTNKTQCNNIDVLFTGNSYG